MPNPRPIAIQGSESPGVRHGADLRLCDATDEFQVTVWLRPRPDGPRVQDTVRRAIGGRVPRHLSRTTFERLHRADADDVAALRAFAGEHGLEVVERRHGDRAIVLGGTVAALDAAFGTTSAYIEEPDGAQSRVHLGAIHVPEMLSGAVTGVLGFDARPFARPYNVPAGVASPRATTTSYTGADVAELYEFPDLDRTGRPLDLSGQTMAIISLGGGYRSSDMRAYYAARGATPPPMVDVSVDGATNDYAGGDPGANGENAMDGQVAGMAAPGARQVFYFAPNTEQGFVNAIAAAIHDRVNRPSVVSISWGAPEIAWSRQGLRMMRSVLQEAAAMGVTVLCASGDGNSLNGSSDGSHIVDAPAALDYITAVGGTTLPGRDPARQSVWKTSPTEGSGGGISARVPRPAYQKGVAMPPSANGDGRDGRGVPDLAANADPATGYQARVGGQDRVFGGTSAGPPLLAALVLRINAVLGRQVGFLNPQLYASAGKATTDITVGDNGGYRARPGWDPCTGLGTPLGRALLQVLDGLSVTGGTLPGPRNGADGLAA